MNENTPHIPSLTLDPIPTQTAAAIAEEVEQEVQAEVQEVKK